MAVRRSWQRIEFLSTPSGWRATLHEYGQHKAMAISIHALRVEGDKIPLQELEIEIVFLSTPSGWRATGCVPV